MSAHLPHRLATAVNDNPRASVGEDGRATKTPPLLREVRRHRRLDWLAIALVSIALWSIVGVIVALRLGAIEAAWDFTWSLLASGVTLVAIGILQGRMA